MQKHTYRVRARIEITNESGKPQPVEEGTTIELPESYAATFGDALERIVEAPKRPFVVKRGEFTQGEQLFHEGDEILLTEDEAAAFEDGRLEPAPAPAPAPVAKPSPFARNDASDEGAVKL